MNRSESQWEQPELSANVFRGTPSFYPDEVGLHFSSDKSIASKFIPRLKGALINAEVPISSMETNTRTLKRKGVGNGKVDEKEVTVKTGKPIKVKSVQSLNNGRTRTRTFNPPREMKA
jgi:hypothetical protein